MVPHLFISTVNNLSHRSQFPRKCKPLNGNVLFFNFNLFHGELCKLHYPDPWLLKHSNAQLRYVKAEVCIERPLGIGVRTSRGLVLVHRK